MNFKEPQPQNDRNELKFKNRFTGTYLCLDDSSLLRVEKDRVVRELHGVTTIARAELDSVEGLRNVNGILYYGENEEPLQVEMSLDSATITWHRKEMVFAISEGNVLRYYKGIYFLNFQQPDGLWNVKVLKLEREGKLTLNRILGGEQELERIKTLTTVEETEDVEVTKYVVKPTKRELKNIMKAGVLSISASFQKIEL